MLLGSGVSYASGHPSVQTITDEVLFGHWHEHTDSNFYRGLDGTPARPSQCVTRLQAFLTLLKQFADDYQSKQRGGSANYEDLFYLSRQIEDELMGNSDNPAIAPFIADIRNRTKELCKPTPLEIEFELHDLAGKSCDFIECVVWHLLPANTKPKGFALLRELASSGDIERIDCCTLNHDLLTENFLNENGIAYLDGFSGADGQIRWFDPESYDRTNEKLRLYKLHGSTNWWYLERRGRRAFGIPEKGHRPWDCRDRTGSRIHEIDPRPRFLTGSQNKISEYRHGIFAELHNRFFRLLREHHLIVMSGYGWNDRGINGWLSEWLSASKRNKIILLHRHPEQIRQSRSNMWFRYTQLIDDRQLIPILKWFSETSLADLNL